MKTENMQMTKEERQKFAKALGGNLITVNVDLFEPYVKFAKEYIEFFHIQDSFETFLMRLIYDEVERLHRDLTAFVESKDGRHFVDGKDWFDKNSHVSITATKEPDEENET